MLGTKSLIRIANALAVIALSANAATAAGVAGYDAFKAVCIDTKGDSDAVKQIAIKAKWQELTGAEIAEIEALGYGVPPTTLGAWRGEINGVSVWVQLTKRSASRPGGSESQSCSLYAPPGDASVIEGRMKAELSDNVTTRLQQGAEVAVIMSKSDGGALIGYSYNGAHIALPSFNGGVKSDYFDINVSRHAS